MQMWNPTRLNANNKPASPLPSSCCTSEMLSPSNQRRRCHGGGTANDWAALPRDIVLDIFLRLGPREVMLGAEFACKPWRTVALEEPSLWRRVRTENPASDDKHWRYRHAGVEMAMKLVAVDRAAGQCEAFEGDCGDDYLLGLVARAPSLKCLRIEHYNHYRSGEKLVESLMKLALLEEPEIHFKYKLVNYWNDTILQSVCQACPHLEKLVLMYASTFYLAGNEAEHSKETIGGQITVMPKLHTLKLYDCELSSEGLKAILDSCPVLKTLHIDGYFNKHGMSKELRMKCARVKNLTLPTRIFYEEPEHEYYSFDDADSEDCDSLEEE